MDIVVVNPLNNICMVCLQDTPSPIITKFVCNCMGPFHKPCLETWYSTHTIQQCPVCKKTHNQIKNIYKIFLAIVVVCVALSIPIGILCLIILNK